MSLLESGEMYLESIYILSKKSGGAVRAVDVGEYMGYSKPSVSRAVSLLKKGGYIESDKSGALVLTDKGIEIAEKMFERHTLLSQFLTRLGVEESVALRDACKIEHCISDQTFEAIKKHAEQK